MKLVFDTNVIVAGIVAEGLCRELVEIHIPEHDVVLSTPLWDELVETLREKFDLEIDELPIVQLCRRHARWVEPSVLQAPVCRGPGADRLLATALSGGAEAIVTGDQDLLVLKRWSGSKILSPRGFLERLTPAK